MEKLMVRKINLTGKRGAELQGIVVKGNTGNSIGGDQRKIEGVTGLAEKYVGGRMEHKENDEHKNGDSRGDGQKDGDREKKIKSKDEKNENSIIFVCYNNSNTKPSLLFKESNKNTKLGKRKDLEINGSPHDKEIRPNKLQRPLSSSFEAVENGRKTEPCRTSNQYVSKLVGTVNNQFKIQFAPHEQGTGKNDHKVNINVPLSVPVLENGRTLELYTAETHLASGCQGKTSDHKLDNKILLSHVVLENGKVDVYKAASHLPTGGHGPSGNQKVDKNPDLCLTGPSQSSTIQVKKIVKESLKPLHLDSKI